jgi:hypothetical protein
LGSLALVLVLVSVVAGFACSRALTAVSAHATDDWTQPFVGVEVLHRHSTSPKVNIWAARVNLDAPGVSMNATDYPGSTHRAPNTWAQMVGAQIAVNGDYYGGKCPGTGPICTWGLAAGGGTLWPANTMGAGDGIDNDGRSVVFFNDKSQIEIPPQAEVSAFPTWAKHAIGAYGDVLRNGVVVSNPIGQECNGRPPRTFGGISQNGRTLILGTADAYNVLNTPGGEYISFTCQEIGAFLRELGAYHGVNFDGGNSTAMYIQGYASAVPGVPENFNIVNIPANVSGPGRVSTVANHFGIFATPSGSPLGPDHPTRATPTSR